MPDSKKIIGILILSFCAVFLAVYHTIFTGQSILGHEGTMWYGSFHYYVESLLDGHFPYWDPALMTGTYFYPNLSFLGLLDPTVLVVTLLIALFKLSLLTGYLIFYIARLVIFGVGAYFLFHHVSKSRISAVLAAGILVLAQAPQYLRQPGALYAAFLTPLILFFVLRFFEDPKGPKRYLFIAAAVLMLGISMNVYIPAYELFNLTAFLIVLFLTRIASARDVFRAYSGKALIAFSLAAIVTLVMMMGPGLAVYFKDASGSGELLPIQRIPLKFGGNMKVFMASDSGADALSDTFVNDQGAFNAYGNIVNTIVPDIYESLPYFAEKGLLAEMGGYVGILPLLFVFIGLFFHQSRYRYLALGMLGVIFVNSYSFSGMNSTFNFAQKTFNALFPPLKMIDMRETFGPFLQIYVGMLMSIGLSIVLDAAQFARLLKENYRRVIGLCLAVIALKVAVTAYYGQQFLFASFYDLFVLMQIVFIAAFFVLSRTTLFSARTLTALLFAVILVDLLAFNLYASKYVLVDRRPYDELIDSSPAGPSRNAFDYFREPLPAPPNVAFGENIIHAKGALTQGYNHSPFSTKRYYDFITHIPLRNQFMLTGVTGPIIRFYPQENVVLTGDKADTLRLLASSEDAVDRSLYLEAPGMRSAPARPAAALGSYPDAVWLRPENVYRYYDRFVADNRDRLMAARNDVSSFLHTPQYEIAVRDFSTSEITMDVRNTVDGYLYYNDGWSRYWLAYDKGKEIPVVIANYNFKAVYLEKGAHSVRFVFDPVHYKIGLTAFYAGMMLCAGTIIYGLRRSKSGNTAGNS